MKAFEELERSVQTALETYSNVHRGSGHNSIVSTHLFEQAREIVLEYLGLNKRTYAIVFCTARNVLALKKLLPNNSYECITSQEIGLSLGIIALAIKKNALPKGAPIQTGGGTTKLISKEWIIWADAPDKFEAGTPAVINIIAFAKALRMMKQFGKDIFMNQVAENLSAIDILYKDELEKYSGQELLDELRKTRIGKDILVPTREGTRPFINLDNSASTPTFAPIWEAFRQTWLQPSKVKQDVIQEVKSICAKAMGAPQTDFDLIFTSNTTEAINLTAESLSNESEEGIEPVVLNTLLEHSSNDLPWRMIPGNSVIRLSVDEEGFVDLNELETILSEFNQKGLFGKKRIKLVAISGASNVLGVCNGIAEISQIVHRYGARLLVDAAQLVAHRKVTMDECGIDYLAFSAHKVYAPFGCGVLIFRKGLLQFKSAEMKQIQSSGEENPGGIAALGKALIILQRIGMDLIQAEEQSLTKQILDSMAKVPGLKIYGIKDSTSPGISHKVGVIVFSLNGMAPNRVAKEMALRGGVGLRYGCHCAHIIVKHLLHVGLGLERFQRFIQTLFPALRLPGLVRVSLGIENNKEDVDTFIQVLLQLANKSKKPEITPTTNDKTQLQSKMNVKQQINDFTKAVTLRVYSQQG